jgi:Cu2+-exporting ATPase
MVPAMKQDRFHEHRLTRKEFTMTQPNHKTIHISGMSCGHCSMRVQKALLALEGVHEATVSHADGQAVVLVDDSVTEAALRGAVDDAGYDVTSVM